MQVVDDHHSRSRTHSHAHAPSEAAAAEAGAVTDAAQLPEKLPGESGMSNNFQVNNERPLEQLPVDHEKAGRTISRSQLPWDSGDADVAQKNTEQLPTTPAKPMNDWVSLC